jgi:hypothetical protein
MEYLIFIFILIAAYLVFRYFINNHEDYTISNILKKGNLTNSDNIRGHVNFKKVVKHNNNESYMIYLRLEDGKEIVINNMDYFLSINTGDSIFLRKDTYSHKSGRLVSYYSTLDKDFERNALYNEVFYMD